LAAPVKDDPAAGARFVFQAAEVTPDGSRLASKSGHVPQLYETASGKEVQPISDHFGESHEAHSGDINYVGFSPNGRFLVTASQDRPAGVWNASHGDLLRVLKGHADRVWHGAFATDNRRVVTSSADRTARLWDTQVDRSLLTLGEQIPEVRFF